jgi:hypothetical protein
MTLFIEGNGEEIADGTVKRIHFWGEKEEK